MIIEPDGILKTTRETWAHVLEVPVAEVTHTSEFFADGGDSLLAVELVVALGEHLKSEIGLDALFLDGTFGALVLAAEEAVRGSRE